MAIIDIYIGIIILRERMTYLSPYIKQTETPIGVAPAVLHTSCHLVADDSTAVLDELAILPELVPLVGVRVLGIRGVEDIQEEVGTDELVKSLGIDNLLEGDVIKHRGLGLEIHIEPGGDFLLGRVGCRGRLSGSGLRTRKKTGRSRLFFDFSNDRLGGLGLLLEGGDLAVDGGHLLLVPGHIF
jgi:hypothetical protein